MARPVAIVVVSAFLLLATVIAVVVGTSLLFPNPLLDRLWELNRPGAALFHSIGRTSGVLLLALACGTLSAAFGLLHGRRWAWWFAVILFSIDVAGNVFSFFQLHDALRSATGGLISAIFLLTLTRASVRNHCGIHAQGLTSNPNREKP